MACFFDAQAPRPSTQYPIPTPTLPKGGGEKRRGGEKKGWRKKKEKEKEGKGKGEGEGREGLYDWKE
jgi:hypothetical protein